MVYKIVWTFKALQTYMENMHYLETVWKPNNKNALLVTGFFYQQKISISQSVLIMRGRVPQEHIGTKLKTAYSYRPAESSRLIADG